MAASLHNHSEKIDNVQTFTRSYQLEMFEESLKGNTVVVMGTGSGKTHVYALFNLIWFLTPTVPLCDQQFNTIRQNIPSTSARQITGRDDVERWSTQEIWDKLLGSHQIIVSTHAILSDALSHGFVTMDRLGLLIFDEAHHCQKGHPANKIMMDFYHPSKQNRGSEAVPKILGLTATPIHSAKAHAIDLSIEKSLDAVCLSPRRHNEDLRRFVHEPELKTIYYNNQSDFETLSLEEMLISPSFQDLLSVDSALNKWVKLANQFNSLESGFFAAGFKPAEARTVQKKAQHVCKELGSSASQLYLALVLDSIEAVDKVCANGATAASRANQICLSNEQSSRIGRNSLATLIDLQGSEKFELLINFFQSRSKQDICGILFVEQRVIAVLLQLLLSRHTKTNHHSYGSFVGASSTLMSSKRRTDLIDLKNQAARLQEFRSGECNIMVSTSVLDEGIDVPSCNLVICFDRPHNYKSFIQRRGRARDMKSNFVIFEPFDNISAMPNKCGVIEAQLQSILQEDRRVRKRLDTIENMVDPRSRRFEVKSTCALLTLENAVPHLNHFCAKLPKDEFSTTSAIFKFIQGIPDENNCHPFQAHVTLPNSLHPSLRFIRGSEWWKSERQAKKDAAFNAYVQLYRSGLVNDNLLPEVQYAADDEAISHEDLDHVQISVPFAAYRSLWAPIAEASDAVPFTEINDIAVEIKRPGKTSLQFHLLFPFRLPQLPNFQLFRTPGRVYHLSFESGPAQKLDRNCSILDDFQQVNDIFMRPLYHRRMQSNNMNTIPLIVPSLDPADLVAWKLENAGTTGANEAVDDVSLYGRIIRSAFDGNNPRLLRKWLTNQSLLVESLDIEQAFLRPNLNLFSAVREGSKNERRLSCLILPVYGSILDNLRQKEVEISLLFPSLLHQIEKYYIAYQASVKIFGKVDFQNLEILVESLTAPSTCEKPDQRILGFIGHMVFSYLISVFLFPKFTKWHGEYLYQALEKSMSRGSVAKAAIRVKLPQYIMMDVFKPSEWKPIYAKAESQAGTKQEIIFSTQVLVDTVEAAIAAAFVHGGLSNAVRCFNTIFPEFTIRWPLDVSQAKKISQTSEVFKTSHFDGIQKLLDYKFNNICILTEAITHPSLIHDTQTQSYSRLKFMGNAVVDMILVQSFTKTQPFQSEGRMQLVKSAFMNRDFFAFLCLEFKLTEQFWEIVESSNKNTAVPLEKVRKIGLCEFLRFQSTELAVARTECMQRHEDLRLEINHALEKGQRYPWSLISRLQPRRFLSDMLQAFFGAILVDSGYSLSACEKFAERIGLKRYIDRSIRDEVDLCHPKSRLAEIASGDARVDYRVRKMEGLPEQFACTVSIDDLDFEVTGAGSENEAKTRAAETAVDTLIEAADILEKL